MLVYVILGVWTWSMLQFPLHLAGQCVLVYQNLTLVLIKGLHHKDTNSLVIQHVYNFAKHPINCKGVNGDVDKFSLVPSLPEYQNQRALPPTWKWCFLQTYT